MTFSKFAVVPLPVFTAIYYAPALIGRRH